MEAHRESEVHFGLYIQLLPESCFILPPATAFSTSSFQETSAPADKLVPANLSKKRQPTTSYRSSKTRSERSCPQEKHLFLPFPYTSLGREQRVTPIPKKELMLLTGHSDAQTQGLMISDQKQGMQVTKQNQILLFSLPLHSRRSHPCLLYRKVRAWDKKQTVQFLSTLQMSTNSEALP